MQTGWFQALEGAQCGGETGLEVPTFFLSPLPRGEPTTAERAPAITWQPFQCRVKATAADPWKCPWSPPDAFVLWGCRWGCFEPCEKSSLPKKSRSRRPRSPLRRHPAPPSALSALNGDDGA